jgi:hypothetical protein
MTVTYGYWTFPLFFTLALWVRFLLINKGYNTIGDDIIILVRFAVCVFFTLIAWSLYFAARLYGGLPQ